MKLAVTGARGFIGRHVLSELAEREIEVIATVRPGNEGYCPKIANTKWVTLDIKQPPDRCFTMLGEPDVLLHLAWGGLPNYRSLHHFEAELPLQYRFLSGLIHEGLGSLVSVGTCFEYGFQSGPLAADLETRPANSYGFAKDVLRKQLEFLQELYAFNLAWPRLFYMYGEGQPKTSLFSLLKQAVSDGKPIFRMSGGEQLRDYLPVAEVAKRLVDLVVHPQNLGVLNICSGKPISVRALVESWIREHNWNIELALGEMPYPDYEPMAFWGVPNIYV